MKLKMLKDRQIYNGLNLEKDKTYEVLDIIQDTYKIAVPMKRQGKFKHVLVNEDEGELVD